MKIHRIVFTVVTLLVALHAAGSAKQTPLEDWGKAPLALHVRAK